MYEAAKSASFSLKNFSFWFIYKVTRRQSTSNFQKNEHFYSLIRKRMYVYQGVRNAHFPENLLCFVFLLPSFWDSFFCLIPTKQYFREHLSLKSPFGFSIPPLTHLFPMQPFSTSWKHQKTLRCFYVFRGQRKGAFETYGLILPSLISSMMTTFQGYAIVWK